jgi:hypothetical protein
MGYGYSLLTTAIEDNSDMIPDYYEEIASMNYLGNEFGGTESGSVVVEITPKTVNSNEIRDCNTT